MVHFQIDVILHLTNNNLSKNGKPIINVGDLIVFSEEDKNSNNYISYDAFFQFVDMYFEYFEAGTREHRTIKITGLLTRYEEE